VEGAKYRMRHIKSLKNSAKMTGKKGIRLKVSECVNYGSN